MKNQDLIERIIEFSKHNVTGVLLSTEAIETVLKVSNADTPMDKFNELLKEHQTDAGYTVNASIFMDALKKEEPEPQTHREETTRYLEHIFTKTELAEMSSDLARKIIEIKDAEARKKSAMSQFKSEIDVLNAETGELSHKINSGSEEQNIKCEIVYFYGDNKKHIVRLDTGEVIWDGEIPKEEKQVEMTFEEKLDNEDRIDEKAHNELLQNTAPDEQSADTEPDNPEKEISPADGQETEEPTEAFPLSYEEQQAKFDEEDEKIAEDIATNLDESKKTDSGKLPGLPNE